MSNNKLIPELRFPEFVNDGEWMEKKLGKILVEGKLGGNYENVESNKGIPVIKMGNIDRGKISLEKIQYLPQETSYNSDDILKEGDLLFNTRNTLELVGKVAIWRNELPFSLYNSNLMRMTFDENYISSNSFMNYFFNTKIGLRKLKSIATGTTSVAAIYTKDLVNVEINFPSKPEQQKIASCLSSLDEVIAAHSQKLELLKDHKKGLMQNFFPQEGEKVPKYRFKEFEKDGDWVEKKLGAIGDPLMCKRILKEQTTSNSKDGIPFYKIGTFGREADAYIPIDLYEEFKNKYSFPNVGDILISASGTIGRLVVYDGLPAYFQDSNIVWLGNDESLVQNIFLYHCYTKIKWQTSDGGIISRLYNSDLRNMEIHFPKNKIEQQKIASCLSSLDALITAEAEKIEQLKLHKKGLMQGLFPKIITN